MDLDAAKPLGISGFIHAFRCVQHDRRAEVGHWYNWTDQARVATTPALCSAKVHTVTSTQVEPFRWFEVLRCPGAVAGCESKVSLNRLFYTHQHGLA